MSFIKTFSGKHFYYDRINKDDIDINDIAVSLSNICRFAGHLSHFYSVAQHAVLCSQLVPQEFAFEALSEQMEHQRLRSGRCASTARHHGYQLVVVQELKISVSMTSDTPGQAG